MLTTPISAPKTTLANAGLLLLVQSARSNLRRVLDHPAFTPARREQAETFISASTDAAQLMKWKLLALEESEAWEEAQKLSSAAQPSGTH